MQYAKDIRSLIKNNLYYIQKLEEITTLQLKEDLKLNNVNVNVCSTRFRALEHILSACQTIRTYTLGIESNLDTAERQDKLLTNTDVEVPESEDGGFFKNDGLGSTVSDAKQFYEQREQGQSERSGQSESEPRGSQVTRGSEDS